MSTGPEDPAPTLLSLAAFRALRPTVDDARLGSLLCPPYDVIDADLRADLLARDPANAVRVVLPEPTPDGYAAAAATLRSWQDDGTVAVDDDPALYVYEMTEPDAHVTRGLVGAVELRDPAEGVILPHENTMAGPVADRLAVMTATGADLEPIYLVYDGGGPASRLVQEIGGTTPLAEATTPDGTHHRLWAVTDPATHQEVAADLGTRRALIADGHHRYATYRERQRRERDARGAGPWDRGLALLVDTSEYGPQVHAIHRTLRAVPLPDLVERLAGVAEIESVTDAAAGLERLSQVTGGFAAVVTDGARTVVVRDTRAALAAAARRPGDTDTLAVLDVTVLHRGLIEATLGLVDDVDTVGYAHSVDEAVAVARAEGGVAILVRPTPVTAVAAVAAEGGRMPRKSTLFTPKPASGLVMRLLEPDA